MLQSQDSIGKSKAIKKSNEIEEENRRIIKEHYRRIKAIKSIQTMASNKDT